MADPEHSKPTGGFFLRKEGEFVGPLSRDELAVRVRDGTLGREELVQVGGTPIWQPVRVALESAAGWGAVDELPAWEDLWRWTVIRLRREIQTPSVAATAVSLGIASVAMLCTRWPLLFWLPWLVWALVGAAGLLLAGRRGIALLLIAGGVVLPFVLLPTKRTYVAAPTPAESVTLPKTNESSMAKPPAPAEDWRETSAVTPAPIASGHALTTVDSGASASNIALAPRAEATAEEVAAATPAPEISTRPTAPAFAIAPPRAPSAGEAVSTSARQAPTPAPAPGAATPAPSYLQKVGDLVMGLFRGGASKPGSELEAPAPAAILARSTPTLSPSVTGPPVQGGDFVKTHSRALVLVKDEHGAGSGFIASMGGNVYLFTNIHVAAGLKQPEFTLLDGTRLNPVSAEAAVGHDIMRFTLQSPPTQSLETATDVEKSTRIDDSVLVLGNSGGGGVVTSLNGVLMGIGADRIEVSSEFIPGNSGSPIIHAPTGRVIGIATYLTKRYDEFGKAEGNGPGNVTVHHFGYRLDSVRVWEPVNWAEFRAEAEEIHKISQLTEDIFNFLRALEEHKTPEFKTATLRLPAEDWLQRIKPRSAKQHASEADRMGATQGFLGSLRAMTRGDVIAAERSFRYSYFRDELRHERDVRERLSKSFDEQAQELAAVAARGH